VTKHFENKELFESTGIKNTRQRNMTLDILKQAEWPITAEQIFLKLKEIDSAISLSTVYRIMEVFTAKGLAIKSNLVEDTKAMFELNRMEHKHHLICVRCRKMHVVEDCPLGNYERALEKKTDFDITGHRLEIYGYCSDCKVRD